jgi:hypothetical protein
MDHFSRRPRNIVSSTTITSEASQAANARATSVSGRSATNVAASTRPPPTASEPSDRVPPAPIRRRRSVRGVRATPSVGSGPGWDGGEAAWRPRRRRPPHRVLSWALAEDGRSLIQLPEALAVGRGHAADVAAGDTSPAVGRVSDRSPVHLARGHDGLGAAGKALAVPYRSYAQYGGVAAMARQVNSLDVHDTLVVADQIPQLGGEPSRIAWGVPDQLQKVRYGERFARHLGVSCTASKAASTSPRRTTRTSSRTRSAVGREVGPSPVASDGPYGRGQSRPPGGRPKGCG